METQTLLQNPALIWFLVGTALLLGELALPGLVLIFFGAGAWFTSMVCGILEIGLNTQLFIFLMVSLLSLALLRKHLKRRFFDRNPAVSNDLDEEYIGHVAEAEVDFINGFGKIKFRGTTWEATSDQPIHKNERVTIISKESIKLNVKPLNS